MSRVILLALLSLVLCACNQATSPVSPESDAKGPSASELLSGNYDPLDDFFREGAGVIDGDVTLNGATETDPSYDTSPYVVTQPAKNGDIAIYRIRGKLTTNATTTLYTKQSSPTKNYSSFSVPGTNVDQYKAMYVTNTEPLHLTFFNSNNFNTPLNGPAAIYDYNYKTTPADNAGEPNDDENGATITDRTLANNLPLGFLATRSVYSFDATKKDLEEWYKVTVNAGDRFSFKYTTESGRFGTWGFTMKVFDPSGLQMGSTTTISIGEGAAGITRTATQSGVHFLQLVGTPSTKNNTNVFFNLYTMTACVAAKITSMELNPNLSTCPGTLQSWQAGFNGSPTSFSWNFGGGCIPNDSSSQTPIVTLGAAGDYTARLTLVNDCNFTTLDVPYTVGCTGWAGTQGGSGATVNGIDIVVDPDGTSRILGTYQGTADLDPSSGINTQASSVPRLFLGKLDPEGQLEALEVIGGQASTAMSPEALIFDSTEGYRITGRYAGTVDFDSGVPTVNKTSTTEGEVFLLALSPTFDFRWVNTFATDGEGEAVTLLPAIGQTAVMGTFAGNPDFDPGFSTFNKNAGTGKDAYCMLYENATGRFTNGVAWGNTSAMLVNGASTAGNTLDIVGRFTGTVDFDPGAGTTNLTNTNTGIYLLRLTPSTTLPLIRARNVQGSGTVDASDIVTTANESCRLAGSFQGTTDFDPNAGVTNRTSLGAEDAFLLALNPLASLEWVYTVGGAETDLGLGVTQMPATGELRLIGGWKATVDFDPGVGSDVRVSTGVLDAFMVNVSSTGTRVFASTWGGNNNTIPSAVGVDLNGATVCIGNFTGQVDFDPGPGTFVVTGAGPLDSFIQKILPTGTW